LHLWICLLLINTVLQAQEHHFLKHSHNDYEQEVPLYTALDNNFNSIEVDIFEFAGTIVVSHDEDQLEEKPSLNDLYLHPLSKYPFRTNQTLFLLIDLKMNGHTILDLLHEEIKVYPELFKNRNSPSKYTPLQIVLSGSVDKDYVISNDAFSYFFVDGRLDDLEKNYDSGIMPLISADLEDLYCWRTSKKVTKNKLKPVVDAIHDTHQQNKFIRFWNTADEPTLWDLLIALNVDIIGVDNIDRLVQYSTKF